MLWLPWPFVLWGAFAYIGLAYMALIAGRKELELTLLGKVELGLITWRITGFGLDLHTQGFGACTHVFV